MSNTEVASTRKAERAAVLVVGCGARGSGIAQVALLAGHEVFLFDALDGAAAKARERIAHFLQRDVDREHRNYFSFAAN